MNYSKWFLLLLFIPGAYALQVISPLDHHSYNTTLIPVLYSTGAGPCTAGWGASQISLPACGNFTYSALTGENLLWVSDGVENVSVLFFSGQRAAPPNVTAPTEMRPVNSTTNSVSELGPRGMVLRGRTPYNIGLPLLTAPDGRSERASDLLVRTGVQRLEFNPAGGRIKRVILDEVSLPQQIDLGLEEISRGLAVEHSRSVDAFAVDPTRVAFTNGTITKTAVGNNVWKCAAWDFDAQTCTGEWVFVARVTPGTDYNITFNAVDPAFAETFDTDPTADVDIAALDSTTLVIAWIDRGAQQAAFEVWDTIGTRLVDEVVINTSSDNDSRIAVSAINSTHFTIAVVDGVLDDVNFYIFDKTGTQRTGITQVDINAGLNTDVDACQLGDRFATPYADDNDNDANYRIWSNTGSSLLAESAVDTTITPGATLQNLVSCSALNSTQWGYAFYDDADNDVTLAVVLNTGTIQVVETDIDTDVGETGQVATASLRYNKIALAFYDSTDQDITITIRGTAAAALNTTLAATDIDTAAGTDSRVAAAEIRNGTSNYFVVAWQDNATGDIKAGVYNELGTQLTAPFSIVTSIDNANKLIDVAGSSSLLGNGLCNGTFAIAYTNGSSLPVFDTYYMNGTHWNGVCGAPDTAPPVITVLAPANATTNTSSNTIDFFFNVSDQSTVANCTLEIVGDSNTTLIVPTKDSTINITTFLSNGDYQWDIICVDVVGNTNSTLTYDLSVNVPLLISASDLDLIALDNTTLVIGFIDLGQTDASFEIWDANGTKIVDTVDVDTTIDADSRVSLEAINSTHFVFGVIDGPLDDVDFYIYDRTGTQTVGLRAVDTSAGLNNDLAICEMGDRFNTPYADNNDNDANYRAWSNDGTSLYAELAVDTTITPGATLQNLVSCSALNTSQWGYAFYDDADNDISMAVVLNTGTVQVTSIDLDTDVGETGQVATAGLRNNRIAVAYYDATDQDVTIGVYSTTAAALSTILAVTDIDVNAGTESRVAASEIENNGASNFVVAWQDNATGDIKAGVYNGSGAQVTAPFTIETAANPSSMLLDIAGYTSVSSTGLCNGTFAIAYTNSSSNSLFKTYYYNGTPWNGHCGEPPNVTNISMLSSVVLNAGTTKIVECNISATDDNSGGDMNFANATLYYYLNNSYSPENESAHYTNASCAPGVAGARGRNFTCTFAVQFFAPNGTWYCEGMVMDSFNHTDQRTGNTTIDPLYAINVTNTLIDFGDVQAGAVSSNTTENITNVGNSPINVTVLGYGKAPGDGLSFLCPGENITVGALRFAPNITAAYAEKEALNSTFKETHLAIARQTAVGQINMNTSYWQVQIPSNFTARGICNGTIVFQANPIA